jgi:hypothetical protein
VTRWVDQCSRNIWFVEGEGWTHVCMGGGGGELQRTCIWLRLHCGLVLDRVIDFSSSLEGAYAVTV